MDHLPIQLDREMLSTDGANSLGPELPSRGYQPPPLVDTVFFIEPIAILLHTPVIFHHK